MAAIQGTVTVNEVDILEVDQNPSLGLGTVAAIGSLAIVDTGELWQKYGALATEWKLISAGGASQLFVASATGTITTTSLTDVVIPGMTITPGSGTYAVTFQGSASHGTNNAITFFSVYQNGVKVPNSQIQYQRGSAGAFTITIAGIKATVGAAQAIDIRWRVSNGTATLTGDRYMSALRVE